MNLRHVVRLAMYGSFAGVAAGSLLVITNRTSPDLAICVFQFVAIVSCGAAIGLALAYGPRHALAKAQAFWAKTRHWAERRRHLARTIMIVGGTIITAGLGYWMWPRNIVDQLSAR